jgi:hypothetical protein
MSIDTGIAQTPAYQISGLLSFQLFKKIPYYEKVDTAKIGVSTSP